jgi:hypothetical protein
VNPQALHDTARRYLAHRFAELSERYSQLPGQGRAADGYHYTDEARSIFPRYNVVNAILVEIERLEGDDLPEPAELADWMAFVAAEAQSLFTRSDNEIETRVMGEERARFASQVRSWLATPDLQAEPIGYRRVLTRAESAEWRERLEARWGVENLVWYPMISADIPSDVLIVRDDAVWEEPNVEVIRRSLQALGVRRVAELRELGDPDHLLDLHLMAPKYTGAEGIWTDESLSWIAYASHEGTVAFGGTLAEGLERSWPDLDAWRWTTWSD